MKRLGIGVLTGITLLLTACGSFEPETALNESRDQLNAFFTSYEDDEVVADYTHESLTAFLEGDISQYFSENFKEEIPGLVEKIPFEEMHLNPFPDSLDFLGELENKVRWVEYEINNYEIDQDNERVVFFVESKEFGINASSLKITMIQEDNNWKILSVDS
ncbi:hypothetical protein BW721_07570 [Jeotgalibaca sp. PTS2502]|uniref:hypothetical protein n=1 Tax=Jeotgalibaca sp. PTS2502 TaxID=1903686 RepID=UPI0009735E9C|nr:hypothetical protein [Jeotgalibaca sp. PTS2502]APZ49540.1 hypothetical protein BW721_07570 [Jeotgalibaca sp. PTS2502]